MHLNLPRVTADEIGSNASTDLAVWLFFQIAAGHIALPILVATFLIARAVSTHPAVITVCITWIVSGICSTLLFYVGQHKGPEPSHGICIAQASLLGAVPIMTCSAALILAYNVWRNYDGRDVQLQPTSRREVLARLSIFTLPFLSFGMFAGIGVALALKHTDRVNREQKYFYCSLDWAPFSNSVAVISTILMFAASMFELHVAISIHRYWHLLRSEGHLSHESLSLFLRSAAFTAYLLTSTLLNLVSIWDPALGIAPDMLTASVGLALFIIFVTQKQIGRAWSFWRGPVSRPSHNDDTHGTAYTEQPQRRRYRPYQASSIGDMPKLFRSDTYSSSSGAGRSSPTLTYLDMHEPKPFQAGHAGVEIIRRPDDAFRGMRGHLEPMPVNPRNTISTWGF